MILARATVWIHGISGQVECPERLEWARRTGFSLRAQSREASHNWFHFAIPTPQILDDTRFRVAVALVRFRSPLSGGFVNALHVYDGDLKIASADHLSLHPADWHTERLEAPNRPHIQWGLSVSVLVGFGPDGREIEFSAAGCDFVA